MQFRNSFGNHQVAYLQINDLSIAKMETCRDGPLELKVNDEDELTGAAPSANCPLMLEI